MKNTTNYSLLLPDETDLYKIEDSNSNMQVIDTQMKSNQNAISTHVANKTNPHGVTKEQVGLGNVLNVAINDQTPTYSDTTTLTTLNSGEKLNIAFQKTKLAITTLINHVGNKSNPHAVTKTQIGLGSVDDTSDASKPISIATQAALNLKRNISDVIPIINGGTGASTRELANKNIMCFTNVNSAPMTDLPSDYEGGVYVYQENDNSKFPNKPTPWGLLFSIRAGNDITQLWFAQPTGNVYRRSGNMGGWNGLAEVPENRGWKLLQTTKSITLQGDVSGNVDLNVENAVINTVVADDSHNHVMSNVDGLQTKFQSVDKEITDLKTLTNKLEDNLADGVLKFGWSSGTKELVVIINGTTVGSINFGAAG